MEMLMPLQPFPRDEHRCLTSLRVDLREATTHSHCGMLGLTGKDKEDEEVAARALTSLPLNQLLRSSLEVSRSGKEANLRILTARVCV